MMDLDLLGAMVKGWAIGIIISLIIIILALAWNYT